MKSQKLDLARNVLIARSHWDVPVRVGLRPYVRFCRRMDGELKKLVARWINTAAPGALGYRRGRD